MRVIGPYSVLLAAIFLPLYHALSSEIPFDDILQSKPETHVAHYQSSLTDMVSNRHLSLTRFKLADKDHTFYAAKNEPSNTLNSFYFSTEPESGLGPRPLSEHMPENSAPVIIYKAHLKLHRRDNIIFFNSLDSSFDVTTSRHPYRSGFADNSQMTKTIIDQQEDIITFALQKPYIQHDLPSDFQMEWPVNITLFCNCGPDKNLLLSGSGTASLNAVSQQFMLQGGMPSNKGNYSLGIQGDLPYNLNNITMFHARAKLETPSGSHHNSHGSITSLITTEPDVTIIGQYLGIVRLPNHAVDNFAVQFSN